MHDHIGELDARLQALTDKINSLEEMTNRLDTRLKNISDQEQFILAWYLYVLHGGYSQVYQVIK